MRFSFSAEQEEFRATLRRALEAPSPTKEVRRLMATDAGFERDGWQKLNQELGLTAIHIPEAQDQLGEHAVGAGRARSAHIGELDDEVVDHGIAHRPPAERDWHPAPAWVISRVKRCMSHAPV